MDRMRSRRPTFKGQPSLVSRETHEDFKPTIEWIDDQSSRILLVQLPGFKREEIRVQLDKAGKLLIKGSKQVSENNYLDVDQTFDVPEDTIADKIRGRLEDGCLRLVMPKREVRELVGEKKEEAKDEGRVKEKTPSHEEKKDEHLDDERSKDTGEKQNELAQEEKAKSIEEEKKEAAAKYEHPEEKTTSREEKEEDTGEKQNELTREEKAKSIEEEKKEAAAAKYEHPEEKTTSKEAAAKHEHPEEKTTSREEKEEDRKEEKPKDTEEKQNELTRKETKESKDEPVKEEESKNIEEKTTKMKKMREMRERIPSWLDSGTLGKLNRNKKVIVVAVVSFSAGVYACHKLSTCGR